MSAVILQLLKPLWDYGGKWVAGVALALLVLATVREYGQSEGRAQVAAEAELAASNFRLEQANRVREVLEEDSRLRAKLAEREREVDAALLAAERAAERMPEKDAVCVSKEAVDAIRRIR